VKQKIKFTQTGFTLIEVLVALIIVSIGAGAALSALTNAANTGSHLKNRTFGHWVGVNQLIETRLLSIEKVKLGRTKGDTNLGGIYWHWEQDIISTPVQGVLKLTVSVRNADSKEWLLTVHGALGQDLERAPFIP